MEQLILHLVGDYITQSNWMAVNKVKSNLAALAHVVVYSIPFLLIGSVSAFIIILVTHFLIDRYRLATYLVYAKNRITDSTLTWEDAKYTGYSSDVAPWLAMWLTIITDNTLHLICNYLALKWL